MRVTVRLYRLFGLRLCGIAILPVIAYFFLTGRRARRASRLYLERLHEWSAGRLPRGRRPTWWDGFLQHREFGLNILDRVGFWLGDAKGFRLVVHGREHLAALREARKGAVLLSAHLGSFDALRLYSTQERAIVNVVMYLRHARMINGIFKQLDPTIDLRMITPDPASFGWVFEVRRRLAAGEMVGLLGDRVWPNEGRHVTRVPFLGVPALFSEGPFRLATALACPLLFIVGLRRGLRTYDIFVERLPERHGARSEDGTESVKALTRAYVARLEAYCARAPYQWFNFYDFWAGADGPLSRPDDEKAGVPALAGREAHR